MNLGERVHLAAKHGRPCPCEGRGWWWLECFAYRKVRTTGGRDHIMRVTERFRMPCICADGGTDDHV